jgi:tetratricopeptide (TPR) repeat protein
MLTYIMIFVFFIILGIIVFYIVNTLVLPKKIDEIARMIESGQTKAAIKKLNDIIEKDDRNAHAHFLLARAYSAENNSQYAIIEYRQVLKLGRFNEMIREVDVRRDLARLYKERKSLEEAKKEYLILTKIDPDNFENYYELGVIFYNIGSMDKASGFLKKCIALNPNSEMAYYYLGQIHYRNGLHSDSKQMFINAIKLNPKNYKAHYFLGLVLRQLNDYEWAIKEFETAQKSDELKVKSFLAKGSCHMERGHYPKAIQEFDRGLKYTRGGSDTELNLRYFMAECQEKMRDISSAIKNWERIIEVNPKFRDVQEKLKTFAEFRQDDRIKDFMIAGLSQFELMCRKICQGMGFNITDIEIISDTEIEIIATETEGKWRNTRQTNRIIRIIRTTDSVQESLLRQLHESMKLKNATRIMIITTGDYTPKAVEFANTRPIDTLNKNDLIDILKKI